MHKVFLTRRIPDHGIRLLENKVQLEIYEKDMPIPYAELKERIRDKTGVLSMLTDRIDAGCMQNASVLKVISNYAVGYNNIDLETATARGILVTNTPGVLTDATADLTWALLLAVVRRIAEGDRYMRKGLFTGWAPTLLLGTGLQNKTLGIVGMGRIGREVARRATGFKMRILYHDSNQFTPETEKELNAEYRDLENLFTESDFVSLHAPLTDSSYHMVNENLLKHMKPTAYLINTARGEIIDEKILISFLKDKRIAGAALDVFEGEPAVNPHLFDLDNLLIVPHLGSATIETRNRMAEMAVQNLLDALENRKPEMLVNPEVWK